GAGWNGISTSRLEQAAYDSLWRYDFLRTARGAHRQSQSRACCGLGEWEQSDTDHHSVPPGHRQRWQPDRFWRRPSHQEDASLTGKQTAESVVIDFPLNQLKPGL